MDCACTFVFVVAGIALIVVAIVLKGIPLGANKIIPRTAACVAGAALIIPMCCGFGSIIGYGGYLGFNEGMEIAQKNKGPMTTADQMKMQAEIQKQLLVPTVIILAISSLLSIGIAAGVCLTNIKPRTPPEPPNYGYSPPPDPGSRPPDERFRPGGPGNWPAGS
jgi:hypothetical protein